MTTPTTDLLKEELDLVRSVSFIVARSAHQLGIENNSSRPIHIQLETILVAAAASPGIIDPEAYRVIMILHDAARNRTHM